MNYLIVVSTINCFLDYLAPMFLKFITIHLYSSNFADRQLRIDLVNLKQEMACISMVDEFARYAKLQRKYNKLEGELKDKVNALLSSRMKARLFATYAFRVLNGIITVILLYLYRNEPVAILPKGVLWPFQNFFSWPCPLEGAISLPVWIIFVRLVVSMCTQKSES